MKNNGSDVVFLDVSKEGEVSPEAVRNTITADTALVSVTVDNGSEFSDYIGVARSTLNPEKARTQLFFCHAYCSWERGSNENQNSMVRRRYPKGFDFENTTEEEIKELERWMNKYPRGIFNYKSAAKVFREEKCSGKSSGT